MQDEVDDGRFLPVGERSRVAADGGADDGEDAGADDCADAEGRERNGPEGLLEGGFGPLGFVDQLVDRLGGKDLSGQCSVLAGWAFQVVKPDCMRGARR
jgi:hypothetical protein